MRSHQPPPSPHRKRLRTAKTSSTTPSTPSSSTPKPSSVTRKPTVPAAPRAHLRLQTCSFVHWDVSPILALAASPCGTHLAVARSNGLIELRHRPVNWASSAALRFLPSPHAAVSALIFSPCARFLFAARLDGALLVLRLTPEGLLPHATLAPGGGAVWDIAVAPAPAHALALACDDGCVRFVRPDPDFLVPDPTVPGQVLLPTDSAHYLITASEPTKARVLSVAWAPPAAGVDCIAAGDADGGVRWINPADGKLYGRGKLPSLRGQQTAVWTMKFAQEGRDLLCGDSRGMVTVWASATNTLRQEVAVEGLQGALWSSTIVADSANSEIVFFGCAAGGVGGLRSPTVGAEDQMWVPLRGCRFHSHDVRGLASFPSGTIISGSLDARICLFTPGEFIDKRTIQWVLPYHGCVGQPPVQFCRNNKFILARRQRGIDLWSIPSDSQSPPLKLRMKLKSFESDLIACAISSDGSMVSASSLDSFRLYQIWDKKGAIGDSTTFGKVQLVSMGSFVEAALSGAVDMSFCRESLACISKSKDKIIICEADQVRVISKDEIGSSAISLERIASVDGRIGVCDSRGNVFSALLDPNWAKSDSKLYWKRVFSSENAISGVTAMCFSPSGKQLAIATTELKVFIKQIDSAEDAEPVTAGLFEGVITSLSFSENEESLLVSGENVCSVVCALHSSRKRKHGKDSQLAGFEPYNLRVGDSVLGSCVLGTSRVAVVRRRWDLVQYSCLLPDAIPKKPFGT